MSEIRVKIKPEMGKREIGERESCFSPPPFRRFYVSYLQRLQQRLFLLRQQVGETFQMAVAALRQHKFQSALTLLGIIIGVATVIVVVSVIEGLNQTVTNAIRQLNPNIFIVARIGPDEFSFGRDVAEMLRTRPPFKYEDALAIRAACLSVKIVSPFHTSNMFSRVPLVTYGGEEAQNPILRGVDPFYMEATGLYIAEGRFITEADSWHRRQVCVIGAAIRDGLFSSIDPIGKGLRIDGREFTVVGVLERRELLFEGPSENQLVLIPFGTFTKYYPERDQEFLQFICSVARPEDMAKAIDEVIHVLRRQRRLRTEEENNFTIFTPDKFLEIWHQVSDGIFLLMIGVSSIGLLIGGIGVMNIMLVSVTERFQEIGIRKAVGARQRDILWQFLLEALILTSVGGVLGIVVGVTIGVLVSAIFPSLRSDLSPWSAVAGFLVSASVGLFFGIWPANRAARLDPIKALSYER